MPRSRRHRRPHRWTLDQNKQAETEREEYKIFECQSDCFQGTARVLLKDISVGDNMNRMVDDQLNVARLKEVMRIEGCLRLDRACHVPVVVNMTDWNSGQVWLDSDGDSQPQIPYPRLSKRSDYTLLALDRESLITAAKEIFEEIGVEDPWWVVDVYVVSPCKLRREGTFDHRADNFQSAHGNS